MELMLGILLGHNNFSVHYYGSGLGGEHPVPGVPDCRVLGLRAPRRNVLGTNGTDDAVRMGDDGIRRDLDGIDRTVRANGCRPAEP